METKLFADQFVLVARRGWASPRHFGKTVPCGRRAVLDVQQQIWVKQLTKGRYQIPVLQWSTERSR